MAKPNWPLLVSIGFTIATWVTPIPERWGAVCWAAWLFFMLTVIGWSLANSKRVQSFRAGPKGAHRMTTVAVIAIGMILGGSILGIIWKLTEPHP